MMSTRTNAADSDLGDWLCSSGTAVLLVGTAGITINQAGACTGRLSSRRQHMPGSLLARRVPRFRLIGGSMRRVRVRIMRGI